MGGAHNVALANIRKGLKPKVTEAGHANSYYDKDSPHFMGGAHNVALSRVASQKTMGGARNVALSMIDSQEDLGGAHNAAYQSMRVQASRKQEINMPDFSKLFNSRKAVAGFIGFMVTVTLCISFYVNFSAYHASLEKLDKLTTLFHNPNARVASGEQGKRILKKIGVTTEAE